MSRVEVYLGTRPGYTYAEERLEKQRYPPEDWSWHIKNPESKRALSMEDFDPVWKYYLYDHKNQISRCLYKHCRIVIVSKHPKILAVHLGQEHLPGTEYTEFVWLKEQFKKDVYRQLNDQSSEESDEDDTTDIKIEVKEESKDDSKDDSKTIADFLSMNRAQQNQLYSKIRAKVRNCLDSFKKFTLFVKVHVHSNKLIVLVFVSRYLTSTHQFETLYLDALLLDSNLPNLSTQLDSDLIEILSTFGLNTEDINGTIIECPSELSYLRTQLKLYNVMPSFCQKLTELSTRLNNFEAPSSSETNKLQKFKETVVDELSNEQHKCSTIDCVVPFIEKLQAMTKNDPHQQYLSKLVHNTFSFAIDSKCNDFCSNFVLATYFNPKLAGDMSDSSTSIAETELKRRVIQRSRRDDTQKELTDWKSDIDFASLVSLNALLSADSKTSEANFNAVIFWTEKRQKYPTLSKIAINLLTIPASVQTSSFNEFSFNSLEELKHQAMFLFNNKFSKQL